MSQPNQNNNNHDHKFTKIFVGGLAWKTTTDDLRRFFQRFGEVLDANVVSETFQGGITKSKGYGFVTFRDVKSAARACELPYPVIEGRQTNINLAYIRAKNNQPNQNGLLHRYQAGPSHQYQNGWIIQAAPHQSQLYSHYTNPHFPPAYWYPNYGQYCYMYNVPHYPYLTTMNWHQTSSQRTVRISPPPHKGIRIEDITETNQDDVHNDDNIEEANTEPYSDVDQQKGKDHEREVSGQDNGIKQDVKDRELVMTSGQHDDIKQDANVTKQLDNGVEFIPQIVIFLEEEVENTPKENGVDHGENGENTSQRILIDGRRRRT